MLIQTSQELQAIYPNSKWDKIETLFPMFQRIENTFLRSFLGSDLIILLNEKYQDLKTISSERTTPTDDRPSLILQACQQVIAYKFFADNSRLLSSSLNRGGGFNRATAANYDDLTEAELESLSKEMFHNANQSLEQLITLLEDDAKSDKPIFREAWSTSEYYYLHQDLFFSTSIQLHTYYKLDGKQNKRVAYNELLPTIRSQQLLSIESHLGHDLTQSLLLVANGNATDISQVLVNYEIEESNYGIVTDSLKDFITHVRLALAAYIRADLSTKPSDEARYHTQGDHILNLGIRNLLSHADIIPQIILTSPLAHDYRTIFGSDYQPPTSATVPSDSVAGPTSAPVPDSSAIGHTKCSCQCSTRSTHILDLT